MQYDVFVSYRRKDSDRVRPLVDALKSRGLSVWFDQTEIGDFAPITDEIRSGLANSKVLLAWYSAEYPKSRPCQMELTAAFIAAQRAEDPRKRILVVNPESSALHVEPVELRDEQHAAMPRSAEDYVKLAERIVSRVLALNSSLGAIIQLTPPAQYGQKLVSARNFVGRLPDLWRVHSALNGAESAIITGELASGLVQVSGMGGVGKSLLAEEYALRFSAAYPGGIFWLHALGNDANRPALATEQQDAVRADQFRSLAIGLAIDGTGLDVRQIEALLTAKLGNAKQPFLWIVDDLASGLGTDAVRAWLAPHPLGKTLFTTRSREYEAIGNSFPLGLLTPQEAFDLLCAYRKPQNPKEEAAAHGIASDLGYHPLAVVVCSRALEAEAGLRSFAEFRSGLATTGEDELELAAELAGVLPNGHEKSIAATLLRSVRSLPTEGRDFLRLASLLAAAPIPASLVVVTFTNAYGLEEGEARHRATRGLSQAEKASLAEHVEDNARTVHTLISRTIRFHDSDPARNARLRSALITALKKALPEVADISSHDRLALEVLHARELCTRGIDDTDAATVASWVARHDFERGAYPGARSLEKQVLAVRRRILGEEHPDTLISMNNLAVTLRVQGDLASAHSLHEQVLAVRRRILGEEHPDTLISMNSFAETLSAKGDLSGARSLHEQALAVRIRILGENHSATLTSMNNLAVTLHVRFHFRDPPDINEGDH